MSFSSLHSFERIVGASKMMNYQNRRNHEKVGKINSYSMRSLSRGSANLDQSQFNSRSKVNILYYNPNKKKSKLNADIPAAPAKNGPKFSKQKIIEKLEKENPGSVDRSQHQGGFGRSFNFRDELKTEISIIKNPKPKKKAKKKKNLAKFLNNDALSSNPLPHQAHTKSSISRTKPPRLPQETSGSPAKELLHLNKSKKIDRSRSVRHKRGFSTQDARNTSSATRDIRNTKSKLSKSRNSSYKTRLFHRLISSKSKKNLKGIHGENLGRAEMLNYLSKLDYQDLYDSGPGSIFNTTKGSAKKAMPRKKARPGSHSRQTSKSRTSLNGVWNRLHSESQSKIEVLYENHLKSLLEKEYNELKECTFRPKLRDYRNISLNSGDSFYERSKQWKGQKEKRMAKEREEKKEEEHNSCSFRPQVDPMSRFINNEASKWRTDGQPGSIAKELFKNVHIYNETSIRKHIERQLIAQFEKFVKDSILQDGRPPQKEIKKLMKSLSTNKILPPYAKEVKERSRERKINRKLFKKKRKHKSISDLSKRLYRQNNLQNLENIENEPPKFSSKLEIEIPETPGEQSSSSSSSTPTEDENILQGKEELNEFSGRHTEENLQNFNLKLLSRGLKKEPREEIKQPTGYDELIRDTLKNPTKQIVEGSAGFSSKEMSSMLSNEEFYIKVPETERGTNEIVTDRNTEQHANINSNQEDNLLENIHREMDDTPTNSYHKFKEILSSYNEAPIDPGDSPQIKDYDSRESMNNFPEDFNQFVRLDDYKDLDL
ncbi:unnamed protein product [Moneuplotes crassus]|uniref:Uncharacterized protein n=1 Tax=Euplotes crassus TaxID=5936 RepID=A0AAD1XY29_EUPCR|nr:unnamed protein product [Moneuplotes crassus]